MKALILMDSFKGCLSSGEAALAASEAFCEQDKVKIIEVSDGGEGFSSILTRELGGELVTVPCHNPLGDPMEAFFGLVQEGRTAVVETAQASGLGLVPPSRRDPAISTTYGTGELISSALDMGVERIWIGLGGSATCDCGIGMLQALGYRFFTPYSEVSNPVLSPIVRIDPDHRHRGLRSVEIEAFYDGDIPLCGRGGAALSYSAQKGAGPRLREELDGWLHSMELLYGRYSGTDTRLSPGAGAAGGLGAAFSSILHATMRHGIERFLDIVGFGPVLEEALAGDDLCLVITGEGRSDSQTLAGKVPIGVLDYVKSNPAASKAYLEGRLSVILLSGAVENEEAFLGAGFSEAVSSTPPSTPLEVAMEPSVAKKNIREALGRTIEKYRMIEKTLSRPVRT